MAFVGGAGAHRLGEALMDRSPAPCCERRRRVVVKAGLGDIWQNLQKQIVKTPGVRNSGLEECPFCETAGMMNCEGCRGTGQDSFGDCLMCSGKGRLVCTVCRGVGKVDIIRKGGTDTKGSYTKQGMIKKKEEGSKQE